MVIGVTGHQDIPPMAMDYITRALEARLALLAHPIGMCSLAAGGDQLFAEAIVTRGGELHVVIPCRGYEGAFSTNIDREQYKAFLEKATDIVTLDYPSPSEEAFFAAGKQIVEAADELIAIWDGEPARGYGGTADVVAYARDNGKPVMVIWPEGIER
jgi:hypothetical protein